MQTRQKQCFSFLKTQASTCTSFDLPSHHFLLRLSQEPWFLPRQGSLHERTHQFPKLLSWKSNVLVLFATISLIVPPKLLLFLSYSHALSIATLSWLVSLSPWSENFRVQNSAACLVFRALPHVHITPVLRHLHWLPVRAQISYKTACLCFNAITFSTPAYLSDLLHLHLPS